MEIYAGDSVTQSLMMKMAQTQNQKISSWKQSKKQPEKLNNQYWFSVESTSETCKTEDS